MRRQGSSHESAVVANQHRSSALAAEASQEQLAYSSSTIVHHVTTGEELEITRRT